MWTGTVYSNACPQCCGLFSPYFCFPSINACSAFFPRAPSVSGLLPQKHSLQHSPKSTSSLSAPLPSLSEPIPPFLNFGKSFLFPSHIFSLSLTLFSSLTGSALCIPLPPNLPPLSSSIEPSMEEDTLTPEPQHLEQPMTKASHNCFFPLEKFFLNNFCDIAGSKIILYFFFISLFSLYFFL